MLQKVQQKKYFKKKVAKVATKKIKNKKCCKKILPVIHELNNHTQNSKKIRAFVAKKPFYNKLPFNSKNSNTCTYKYVK